MWLEFLHTVFFQIKAQGGKDDTEDVLGGVDKALSLNWNQEFSSKVIFHICDAPCHGEMFYEGKTLKHFNWKFFNLDINFTSTCGCVGDNCKCPPGNTSASHTTYKKKAKKGDDLDDGASYEDLVYYPKVTIRFALN